MNGEAQTIVISVGPITHHGTPAQVLSSKRQMKRDLDKMVRDYLKVGKRNAVVKTGEVLT
jgi:hypothetical protein